MSGIPLGLLAWAFVAWMAQPSVDRVAGVAVPVQRYPLFALLNRGRIWMLVLCVLLGLGHVVEFVRWLRG